MNRLPDLSHQRVVRALSKAGFVVRRQGKHISMHNEERNVMAIIPRQNLVKRATLAQLLKDIGLSADEFTELV